MLAELYAIIEHSNKDIKEIENQILKVIFTYSKTNT